MEPDNILEIGDNQKLLVWKKKDGLILHSTGFVDRAIMNGLRRTIHSDVDTLGFTMANVLVTHRKSDRFSHELIQHRASLIPLKTNRPNDYHGDLTYILHGPDGVTHPVKYIDPLKRPMKSSNMIGMEVTSDMIKCYRKNEEGIFELVEDEYQILGGITLAVLYPRADGVLEELRLEMTPIVGSGRTCSNFVPVRVAYRIVPNYELAIGGGEKLIDSDIIGDALRKENAAILARATNENEMELALRKLNLEPNRIVTYDKLKNPQVISLELDEVCHSMDAINALAFSGDVLLGKVQSFATELASDDHSSVLIEYINHHDQIMMEMLIQNEDSTLGELIKRFCEKELVYLVQNTSSDIDIQNELYTKSMIYSNIPNDVLAQLQIKIGIPDGLVFNDSRYLEIEPRPMRFLRIVLENLIEKLILVQEGLNSLL